MIEISNVNKIIGDRCIISNFNYKFEKGKIYLLSGHNGCGKTMLLRLISGLISPSDGLIKKDIDLRYGVIIENPTFMNNETAMDNLKFLANINKIIGDSEILESLKSLNLFDKKDEIVKKFSLGMKQRLAIAQAIMENPDVILLDEPFNALDEENLLRVTHILINEKKKNKIIIIASHGINNMNIIDEEIKLSSGKITDVIKNS